MARRTELAIAIAPPEPAIEAVPAGGYAIASRGPRPRAWFLGNSLEMFVVRGISPHAVWLEALPQSGVRVPDSGPSRGQLWLEWTERRIGPLSVELISTTAPDWLPAGADVAAQLAVLRGPLAELRTLAGFVQSLEAVGVAQVGDNPSLAPEWIHDRAQLVELLELLAREGVEGSVRTVDGRCTARLLEVDLATGNLRWQGSIADWTAPTSVEFAYLHAAYQVPVTDFDPKQSVTRIPDWITKSVRRGFRRAAAPEGLLVRFVHPLSPELRIEQPLRDLSRSGLSFEADVVDQLLYPGLEIGSLEIALSDGSTAQFRGRVRSCRGRPSEARRIVGMSIEPASAADADLLRAALQPALYPSTRGQASDVWRVHESSGYLNLSGKQPQDFERIRLAFTHTAAKLERAPEVASVAYWPARGTVEATISHFKVYQSSWLVCQLSKVKGEGSSSDSRRGIRDMYLRIYEGAQADPDTRWLLGYVQDAAPTWSRQVHVGIPQRYAALGEGCLVPFRALECDVAPSNVRKLQSETRVVVADPITAKAAMRDLYRVRPAQYLDAIDLTEDRWDIAGVRNRWNAAGLERQRQILVAYEGNVRCALAVVEVAEFGVHIYGLLDCLRMYPLRPGGERAFGALLREAHSWFSERGRQRFAYLEEFSNTLPVFDLGFRNLGGATFTMLSIDRLPELIQRVADLASRRPPPPRRDGEARP